MSSDDGWALRAVREWKADGELRSEFRGDLEAFILWAEDREAKRRGITRKAFAAEQVAAIVDVDAEFERAQKAQAFHGNVQVSRDFVEALATAWQSSPKLRGEFLNDFSAFRSFYQNVASRRARSQRVSGGR